MWRFEQMATNVNVRIDKPSDSGMEHYVGLENLIPIHCAFGAGAARMTNQALLQRGHIFARRRAYQRKLGVAEFDGIVPRTLAACQARGRAAGVPTVLHAERSVHESGGGDFRGSLSLTINWKTMAVQEFALPPMEEQQNVTTAIGTGVAD
ncbi:hypothetical protein [Accumulibacter sp.]|uniref:hypothetical protein n=1 Tax=Accumulibacter sp. TaxID=2053492 RepID=UPI0025888875|nr:hypothetical protein [Accumulibacter sp.]